MKLLALISFGLVIFAGSLLILTITEEKTAQQNCEQFRFTAIHNVPKKCFSYFEKEFK